MSRTAKPISEMSNGQVKLTDRIASKIIPVTESGCWLWIAGLGTSGYGQIYYRGGTRHAHRVVYEVFKGSIPPGFEIDHLCRVRCCVNPDHLRACTGRENVLAPWSLAPTAINSRKTHCKHGHPYTVENTRHRKTGRSCRQCQRIYDKNHIVQYRARKNASMKIWRDKKRANDKARDGALI